MKRGKTMGNKSTTTRSTAEVTRGVKRGSTRGVTRARGHTGTLVPSELAHPVPATKSTGATVTSNIQATFETYSSNIYHRSR